MKTLPLPAQAAAVCVLLVCSGCAGMFRPARPVAQPVNPQPPLHREEAIKQFDAMHDRAQLEAAQSYWRQGDAARTESELKQLLSRSPEQRPALLLLAEVYLTTDRPAPARELFTRLVAGDASDARLHHGLGLACEALGETAAARTHFQEAARLAPNNPTYAADLASAKTLLSR